MKKALLATVLALTFAFFVIGCTKENNNQPIQKSERIPIAKLTDGNKIEHLFLQKDVKEYFSKRNADVQGYSLKNAPDAELIFIEVVDEENDGEDVGLLYRIHYGEDNVTKTSIIFVLTLEGNIYYYKPDGGGGSHSTCEGTGCESTECIPKATGGCTPCPWGKCKITTESIKAEELTKLTGAIEYAVSVYQGDQSGD